MLKKRLTMISIVMVVICMCTSFFVGCNSSDKETPAPTEYTIQYTDDYGTHNLTVTSGMPYSLEVLPTKTGYDFLGLFDAESGGTKYVSSNGSSVSVYNDKKNIVLFPRFKAKKYTVILDYQGAPATGTRQFDVQYDESLPELPKNLTMEHKKFVGWYTEAECGGVQIADQYGLIPLVSVLNEQNFNVNNSSITLYAGFEMEKHTVTFCFESGMDTEEMQVAYDTPINKVVPKTRVNGNAVLTWSKTNGGEVFNGKVTSDMVLYAVEYAPVIEFDSNGGKEVTPIVARVGDTVSLPTPTKDLAKFLYWEDMSGNKYTSNSMPSTSKTLKAVWQAKIVFDENGGSDVDDISVAVGNAISLPSPQKAGYLFAGWYTADKKQYTSTTMPAVGIRLKAGWYKQKDTTVVVYSQTSSHSYSTGSLKLDKDLTIDLSEYLPDNFKGTIKFDAHIKARGVGASLSNPRYFRLALYMNEDAVDKYKVCDNTFKITNNTEDDYADYEFSVTTNLVGNKIFGATENWYHSSSGIKHSTTIYTCGYYLNLTYPDVTILYL